MRCSVGIDVGSTTVKIVAVDLSEENRENRMLYSNYCRHNAEISTTLNHMFHELFDRIGNVQCMVSITGSGGLAIADVLEVPFIQEVIAVTTAIKERNPETDVVIELGGEDAKIVFFKNGIEQRMNGICAGGTGAFIDQMAALLQTDAQGLNEYAKNFTGLYPIAARCGVFAKSDIQPLINDGASRENLSASIFQAVVNQTISGLACGRKIEGNVAFLGGPLFFLSELREAFIRTLKLKPEQVIFPENAHLFAAEGTAMAIADGETVSLNDMIRRIETAPSVTAESNRLTCLFDDDKQLEDFRSRQRNYNIPKKSLEEYRGDCYLGIDAGSTTTKLALISDKGELLYSFYGSNQGNPIEVAKEAFRQMHLKMRNSAHISYACSTGYGENLFKDAFRLDEGEVETISHYYAARFFEPDVDCILDIGGQDMKCIGIRDGSVDTIILNEACSSGCGSFIESFANSLGYSAEEFAEKAVRAKAPIDLGTRCTVFMNSNVKQAQKEGASVEDIAAGLAYSVVRNALFKVIQISDVNKLGEKIVVQGGTFYNDAVLRSFELISGKEVIRPEIAGLMGAFGAALIARERCQGRKSTMLSLDEIAELTYTTKSTECRGCQNHCNLTINKFSGGTLHISGNRCENGEALAGKKEDDEIPNMFRFKRKRLFDYEPLSHEEAYRGEIGLPRVLNMYEDYPFWAVFFRELGFRTVLSPFSSRELFQKGMDSIPSESECYPAKLAHGHIEWLVEHGISQIFYPCVVYERRENGHIQNNFNCPMVMSYPENIRNNIDSLEKHHVRLIEPFLAFTDKDVASRRLCEVMDEYFDIPKTEVRYAVNMAWRELLQFKNDVKAEGEKTLRWMKENSRQGIVLAGRPYHLDPETNHGIPEMITRFGYAVLTEDSVAELNESQLKLRVTNQWVYHARLYAAAQYVCGRNDLNLVQLNSFGCGLDAVTIDQVQELLSQAGKLYTLLKIDEISNLGAAKIRLRSLFAAIRMRSEHVGSAADIRDYERTIYTRDMQKSKYTIICTEMTSPHFEFIEAAARGSGYNLVMLKNEGYNVLDIGLKYVNNDACFPALIVTGQIMDAVLSGRYDTDKLAVLMCQTGGGCRASNYIGFIRKALAEAGYADIPVISVSLNRMESNPGFKYKPKMLIKALQGALYGDLLTQLLHRVRPYEAVEGSADRLYNKWKSTIVQTILSPPVKRSEFYRNCRKMIQDFDSLPIDDSIRKPKVGIVGEVLVKFMPMANNHLAEFLEKEGAEVVAPNLSEFLKYCVWNSTYKNKYLGRPWITGYLAKAALMILNTIQRPVTDALNNSERFSATAKLKDVRENAQEVLQLGNQCGEGWFLAGEVIHLIRNNVDNIVCVQPFGCLPNHVVGKGIIKKVKTIYPGANIVAVDYDPSASKVNQLNRIKLMLGVAKGNI